MAEDDAAFPTLTDHERAVLEPLGERRSTFEGEYLYREGDASYDFYVVLSGLVEIVVIAGFYQMFAAINQGFDIVPSAKAPPRATT